MRKILLLIIGMLIGITATAQVPVNLIKFKKFYRLKNQSQVFIPLGNVAFADTLIDFREGNPPALPEYSNSQAAAGEPDYEKYLDQSYLSLGCQGQITAVFKDNGFIDIDGPDLYFFEIGPSIEAFKVEISSDNKTWINVGKVDGGTSQIDIARANIPKEKEAIYYYIRLTDLASFCSGPTAGADIDAIGTVGGVLKLNVDANLLFDTDKYELKETALKKLEEFKKVISQIPKADIIISGHTDSDADDKYNYKLGKNRADAVEVYIHEILDGKGEYTYKTESYGETQPIVENNSEKNKQKNRRVEILVLPDKEFYIRPKNN